MEWELYDGDFHPGSDIKKSYKNNENGLNILFGELQESIFGSVKPVKISKNQAIYEINGKFVYIGIGNNIKDKFLSKKNLDDVKIKIALPTSSEILQDAIKFDCKEYIFASVVFDTKTNKPYFFFATSEKIKDWAHFVKIKNSESYLKKINSTNRWFKPKYLSKKQDNCVLRDETRNTYFGNELEFIEFAKNLFRIADLDSHSFEENVEAILSSDMSDQEKITEIVRAVKTRNGQNEFKKELLEIWNYRCMMTGITQKELLIASHIKPWTASNSTEKLDPNNGIILSSNMDKLFDNYLISFDEDGYMLISDNLQEETINQLCLHNAKYKKKYNFTTLQQNYLEHHRRIFALKQNSN